MAETKEPCDLVIGQVTAPFGINGEAKVRPETDFPERFETLREVCLELATGEERWVSIRRVRLTGKGILVTFDGVTRRDQVDPLRGAWVKIPERLATPLPEGTYYLHQLLGLHVQDEEGADLGEITEVLKSPANDVYITDRVLIPALRDVVRKVDLARGVMIVRLLPEESEAEARST
jgi:16S rRNA processing protein RimM